MLNISSDSVITTACKDDIGADMRYRGMVHVEWIDGWSCQSCGVRHGTGAW